jgi:hypothetical protein
MRNKIETISDDNGFEMLVDYNYEQSASQVEEGHGRHEVGCLVEIELKSVFLMFDNTTVNLTPFLTKQQKKFITDKIVH